MMFEQALGFVRIDSPREEQGTPRAARGNRVRVVRQPRRRAGFTVVEWLVVVCALVFILKKALLPSLAASREVARRRSTEADLGSIMLELRLYDDGRIPESLEPVLDARYGDNDWIQLNALGDERYELVRSGYTVIITYLNPPQLEWLAPTRQRKCSYFPSRFNGNLNGIDCAGDVVVLTARIVADDKYEFHAYADSTVGSIELPSTATARQAQSLAVAGGSSSTGESLDEEELEVRLQAVQLRGLQAILELIQLDDEGELSLDTLRQDLGRPEITSFATLLLDCDEDGWISVEDLRAAADGEKYRNSDGTLSPEMQILVDYVGYAIDELGLNEDPPPGEERPRLPVEWVARVAEVKSSASLSFADACELTEQYVLDGRTATGLCAKLDAAEQAQQRGQLHTRDNILEAYRNQLHAYSFLSEEDADRLELLSWILQSESE